MAISGRASAQRTQAGLPAGTPCPAGQTSQERVRKNVTNTPSFEAMPSNCYRPGSVRTTRGGPADGSRQHPTTAFGQGRQKAPGIACPSALSLDCPCPGLNTLTGADRLAAVRPEPSSLKHVVRHAPGRLKQLQRSSIASWQGRSDPDQPNKNVKISGISPYS
jgi:hypothetical protein